MLKRTLLFVMVLFFSLAGFSQGSLVFHENFELPSQADSVTSSGPSGWNVGSALASEGSYSDSAKVILNDTNVLITNSFSTNGYSNVLLKFDHICKIENFDRAEIFVSV